MATFIHSWNTWLILFSWLVHLNDAISFMQLLKVYMQVKVSVFFIWKSRNVDQKLIGLLCLNEDRQTYF